MPEFLKTAVVVLLGLLAALLIVVGLIGCAPAQPVVDTPPIDVKVTDEPEPGFFRHVDQFGGIWHCQEKWQGNCYLIEPGYPPMPKPQGELSERSPAPEPSWEPPVRFGPPTVKVAA